MIVSFIWLKEYVALDIPAAEFTQRLMLAGLNHEATVSHGDDLGIDLEVTSNRPDCLGHIGVGARRRCCSASRCDCRRPILAKVASRSNG